MWGAVREVEEKWLVSILNNELNRFVGEFFGQTPIVERILNDLVLTPKLFGLVITFVNEVGVVKPLFLWSEF